MGSPLFGWPSSNTHDGKLHAPRACHFLALAPVLHDRPAVRRDHLPAAANHAYRLDSRGNLVGLRAQRIQDRPKNRTSGRRPVIERGFAEIGLTGMAAAMTNAVHQAAGIRVRWLPVMIEDLLTEGVPAQ